MNLVYFCVFHNKEYLELLKIVFMTIKFFSTTDNIDFLVFTSKDFEFYINNLSVLFDIQIKMKFHDFNSVYEATHARLHIFEYKDIHLYEKILYLDTDIIIQNDINSIFKNNINDGVLYAIEEGTIEHEYHGGWFFDFDTIDKDIYGINSGVLLFKNSAEIKNTFKDIIDHSNKMYNSGENMPCCQDQPFINYHFIKNNKQDSQFLKKYLLIYCVYPPPPPSSPTDIVICHFVWPIGNALHKKERMVNHLNHILSHYSDIYTSPEKTEESIISELVYTWGDQGGEIQFKKDNTLITTWENGIYNFLDMYTLKAEWLGHTHILKMKHDFTKFMSIRKGDLDLIVGAKKQSSIPKIFFQTSKKPLENKISRMIKRKLNKDWKYLHFTDDQIIDFFKENPIWEFPEIINKFNSLKLGEHKADIFRYYFLYLKGGVFMDSDAMIYEDIENIVQDYEFFSVKSNIVRDSIFQGVIGSVPKNVFIYKAIKYFYNLDLSILDGDMRNFHLLCKNLYDIIHNTEDEKIKYILYEEIPDYSGDRIENDNKNILFRHYWRTKKIPNLT